MFPFVQTVFIKTYKAKTIYIELHSSRVAPRILTQTLVALLRRLTLFRLVKRVRGRGEVVWQYMRFSLKGRQLSLVVAVVQRPAKLCRIVENWPSSDTHLVPKWGKLLALLLLLLVLRSRLETEVSIRLFVGQEMFVSVYIFYDNVCR